MNRQISFFRWLPRLLCIVAILFISSFSIDAFAPGMSVRQQFMYAIGHLLPSIILTALLAIAWRWERVGGVIFLTIGLGLIPYIFYLNHTRNLFTTVQSLRVVLVINMPFAVVGVLFLVSYYKK